MNTPSVSITVSPLGYGFIEGSYSLVQGADSYLAASNIVSALRDDGTIAPKAAVRIVSKNPSETLP